MYQNFSPFEGWIIFLSLCVCLCVLIPHFDYQLIYRLETLLVSTFWLLFMMLLWTWAYKYLFESLLSFLLGIYPWVELLDHIVILFLIFWGINALYSTTAAPFYIFISSTQGFQFLHMLINTCCFLFFFFF